MATSGGYDNRCGLMIGGRAIRFGLAITLAVAGLVLNQGVSGTYPVAAQQAACTNGITVPNPHSNPGLVADCKVLLSVLETVDPGGVLNWSANYPMSAWDGLWVDGSPDRVHGVAIDGNGLTGQIPSELGRLSNLQALDFASNHLTGTIPPALGNLSNLKHLSLDNNLLSGSVPQELGRLSNLEALDFASNHLTGTIPSALGNLSNLKHLSLDNNLLSGSIPQELGNIPHLRDLNVAQNDFTGCIPPSLFKVRPNDLHDLGLPACSIAPAPTAMAQPALSSHPTEGQSSTAMKTTRGTGPTGQSTSDLMPAPSTTGTGPESLDPTPIPQVRRGFFSNSVTSAASSSRFDWENPVTLSVLGILITLLATGAQLLKGR